MFVCVCVCVRVCACMCVHACMHGVSAGNIILKKNLTQLLQPGRTHSPSQVWEQGAHHPQNHNNNLTAAATLSEHMLYKTTL